MVGKEKLHSAADVGSNHIRENPLDSLPHSARLLLLCYFVLSCQKRRTCKGSMTSATNARRPRTAHTTAQSVNESLTPRLGTLHVVRVYPPRAKGCTSLRAFSRVRAMPNRRNVREAS
jgi:hypothetical protein